MKGRIGEVMIGKETRGKKKSNYGERQRMKKKKKKKKVTKRSEKK